MLPSFLAMMPCTRRTDDFVIVRKMQGSDVVSEAVNGLGVLQGTWN